MTDDKITDLLEQAAGRIEVRPVPLAGIADGASRARRRRWTATLGGAATVAAAVAGTVLLVPGDDPPGTLPSGPAPASLAGTRLVGIGHAAIAVPEGWATNDARCGTPQSDTVLISGGATTTCLTMRAAGIESVSIDAGVGEDFRVARRYEIDGVAAERSATTCTESDGKLTRGPAVTTCTAIVYLPSEKAAFRAESSTDAATVDEILDRVVVLTDRVAVPDWYGVFNEAQERSGAQYRRQLEELGLRVEVTQHTEAGTAPGFILDVDPGPGTVLAPGDTVTISETGQPRGPQDELTYYVNARTPRTAEGMVSLSNPDDAENPTIDVPVGQDVWAYADGKRSRSFAVALSGDDVLDLGSPESPTYPRSWIAARPGTAVLTLTIEVDGEPYELARVTVNVVEP